MKSRARKIAVALVAAFALVVGLSGAASADGWDTAPPFGPLTFNAHNNFTGVRVTAVGACNPATVAGGQCTFTATSTLSQLTPTATICNVVLTVRINKYGTTWIDNVVVTGAGICPTIVPTPGSLPWTNQICEYTPPNPDEYWDRLVTDFTINATGQRVYGPIYAKFNAAQTAITVNDGLGMSGFGIKADGAGGTAPYNFTVGGVGVTVAVSSVAEECMWFTPGNAAASAGGTGGM